MSPTKLAQIGYRRFDPTKTKGRGAKLEPEAVWLGGPWPGYTPNIASAAVEPGAARNCSNLMDRDGVLTQQNGYARLGSATLPLGDTTPPATTIDAEPVVGIFEGRTPASQAIRRFVVTSDTAAAGRGHLYELVAGAWDEIPFGGGGTAFTGDSSDPATTLVDAHYFAAAGITVFAGGQSNSLMQFPRSGSATEYGIVINLGSLTTLSANSVLSSEERIHAIGTTENGTYFPARWRWTSKGANAQFDPTITGSGFADFNEFGGEGLAVRNLGNKIALYFTTGVQLVRRNLLATDPFTKDVATYGRGPLSTFSVVDVTSATRGIPAHFVVASDGWFLLDSSGQWTELGITQQGYYKWKSEFYGRLDWVNRKRVVCAHDETDHLIYIGWPEAGASGNAPSVVWIYDWETDSVWPAPDWAKMPNMFGVYTEEVGAGETWGSITPTQPWDGTSGSWASFETQVGQRRVIHGSSDGLVFYHSPALVARDGQLPTYLYQMHALSGSNPHLNKRTTKMMVDYRRIEGNGANPTPITLRIESESGKVGSGTVAQTKGAVGSKQIDIVTTSVRAHQLLYDISGSAPVKIERIGLMAQEEDSQVRKEGSV